MLRNAAYGERKTNLKFYRDTNQKEIDLVLEMDGQLHPLEVKRASSADRKAIRAFSLLRKSGMAIGAGGVICMA